MTAQEESVAGAPDAPAVAPRRSRGANWRYLRNGKVIGGFSILVLLVALGAMHGLIADWIGDGSDPLEVGFGPRMQLPSSEHWLGTDQVGRDELALVVTGLWTSLQVGAVAGLVSTGIGIVVAFLSGYTGGWVDSLLSAITDIFLVIPTIPLLIAYSAFAKEVHLYQLGIILALFSWAAAARAIRSNVLSLRSRPYVDLARVSKLNNLEIIFRELMPNMLPYLVLGFGLSAIGAIFALVGLEVIGLGPSNVIDLGLLINSAVSSGALSLGVWPMFLAPIVAIALIFVGLSLVTLGLEEFFNPRLRRVAGE
jgi:peptide/nickel transport system permease protein